MKIFTVLLIALFSIYPQILSAQAAHGIWISENELADIPMQGPAWDALKKAADSPLSIPDLSDQDDKNDVMILAKALVFARTNESIYRQEVIEACMGTMGTETGSRTLALGRNVVPVVLAADLAGLPDTENELFRDWLAELLYRDFEGRTIVSTHADRPNNWGTHAGAARLAIALYLNDMREIQTAAQVFKGYLGDRNSYAGFDYGDLDWQATPEKPVGINPKDAVKQGHSIDGVLPDDQRRAGGFQWPPPQENYVYEGLQGALAQAVMFHRAGFNVWNWEDMALLRAFQWLHEQADFPAEGDDTWQPFIVNYYYHKNFPAPEVSRAGKNIGWTCWTHSPEQAPKESIDITGFLRNTKLGNYIIDARLQLEQGAIVVSEAQTDSTGQFMFNHVSPGTYTLVITHSVFKSLSKELVLNPDQAVLSMILYLDPLDENTAPDIPDGVHVHVQMQK